MKNYVFICLIFLLTNCKNKEQTTFPPLPTNFEEELSKRITFLQKEEIEKPSNDEIKYILAKYYLQNNEINKALIKINESIELTQPSKKHFLVLSECLYKKGDYENALLALQKININELPDDEFAIYTIEIYKKAKKWIQVEEITARILKKNPKNKLVLNLKTDYLLYKNDTLAAIENLIKTIDFDSNAFENKYKLADLYFKIKNNELALQTLKEIIQQNKLETSAILTVLNIYEINKNKDSLATYYQKYLKRDSSNYEIIEKWADFNFNLKKYDIALKYFQKIDTNTINSNDDFWYKLGVCQVYLGKAQQSILSFENVNQTSSYYKKSKYYIDKYKIK